MSAYNQSSTRPKPSLPVSWYDTAIRIAQANALDKARAELQRQAQERKEGTG